MSGPAMFRKMNNLVPTSAAALGMVRAGVHGVFLVSVLATSFVEIGYLPVSVMRPLDLMSLFSWKFYDLVITPQGMVALKSVMVLSLLMSALGYLTRITTKTSALLVIFYQGLLRSFGHLNHDEMTGIYCLIILAFTPCGDGFSVDTLDGAPWRRDSSAYGYPILLMQMVLAWCYFTAGINKLRISGPAYFNIDNLPIQSIHPSLDNLHNTQYRMAFWLPHIRELVAGGLVVAIAWEIFFPLAVFWRRARWWILGFGLIFHTTVMLTMNVPFFNLMAMYLIFVNWTALAHRLSQVRLLRGLESWWSDFRRAPEVFPGRTVSEGIPGEVLLWDGDCGFCAMMVARLQRFARLPFRDQPFQAVQSYLPAEVREWSDHQMHWVHANGTIVGGSRALTEALSASGHPFLAALLESPPCRPFTWLGYRMVARNRARWGSEDGRSCAIVLRR
jgi:predicted DCC family thiol-disulfide oxidoreductase YuxK